MSLRIFLAFVILTNPLFAKSHLRPEPSSLKKIRPVKCQLTAETGSCERAMLFFSRSEITDDPAEWITVTFRRTDGVVSAIVLYRPQSCYPVGKTGWEMCEGVSWWRRVP